MPEIIKPGVIPPERVPFPIGEEMLCSHCGCIWKIVDGDKYDTLLERCLNGRRLAMMDCPTCGVKCQKDFGG